MLVKNQDPCESDDIEVAFLDDTKLMSEFLQVDVA